LTLRVVDAPEARLKEALPITRLLVFLPCLTLALSCIVPLQGPPVQVNFSEALPLLTVADPAALAVPSVGGGGLTSSFLASSLALAVKVAVTVVSALIVTTQLPVPEQPAPLQPLKVEPEAAVAARVTSVPSGYSEAQAPALQVTDPEPVPALTIVSSNSGVGSRAKLAVTEWSSSMVSSQAPVPVQSSLQPLNSEPVSASGTRATSVPSRYCASQGSTGPLSTSQLTSPSPMPSVLTLSSNSTRSKVAVTALSASIVKLQGDVEQLNAEPVPAYREEERVNPNSETETYVALRLLLDTWRWSEVPIYLRVGKRLPKSATEISVHFKKAPMVLFNRDSIEHDQNVLVIRIQPDEGISLRMMAKIPGTSLRIEPVKMDFHYGTSFGKASPEAYERLLLDAMSGDATLFARRDEVEEAWAFIDTIENTWSGKDAPPLTFYPAGSWGPEEADELLARDGRAWRRL